MSAENVTLFRVFDKFLSAPMSQGAILGHGVQRPWPPRSGTTQPCRSFILMVCAKCHQPTNMMTGIWGMSRALLLCWWWVIGCLAFMRFYKILWKFHRISSWQKIRCYRMFAQMVRFSTQIRCFKYWRLLDQDQIVPCTPNFAVLTVSINWTSSFVNYLIWTTYWFEQFFDILLVVYIEFFLNTISFE